MVSVFGKVAGLSSHYRDGVERQVIHVPVGRAVWLTRRQLSGRVAG